MSKSMITKYDIFGIGSAILDIEILASDKILEKMSIVKGSMSLVDESTHTNLMKVCSVDCKILPPKSGGSICNSIVLASALGSRVFFNGVFANDNDGKIFSKDLEKFGVHFNSSRAICGSTGKCLVVVTEDAQRTLLTNLGVGEFLSGDHVDKEVLMQSSWIFIEGYMLLNEQNFNVISSIKKLAENNHKRIALSLSDQSVVDLSRNLLLELMQNPVDLIFCNKNEALTFAETEDLTEAQQKLKKYARAFVITCGGDGAIVFDGKRSFECSGIKVSAINTNGAGDAFAGAFLAFLCKEKSYQLSAAFANYCASETVTKLGPRLEQADIQRMKLNYKLV